MPLSPVLNRLNCLVQTRAGEHERSAKITQVIAVVIKGAAIAPVLAELFQTQAFRQAHVSLARVISSNLERVFGGR